VLYETMSVLQQRTTSSITTSRHMGAHHFDDALPDAVPLRGLRSAVSVVVVRDAALTSLTCAGTVLDF
jgi:hypothetical protein